MNGPEAAHILTVHPPVASPALAPLPAADQPSSLSTGMPPLELYDANIDFYVHYLLRPDHLQQAIASVIARDARGDYRRADPAIKRQLTDLQATRSLWKMRIAAVGQILAVCRGQQFYDPPAGVQALADLKALLHLISLAHYPARIGWGTFDHPQGNDPDWLGSFPQDPVANPFTAFCNFRLATKLGQPGLRLLLIWVTSRDQLPAVATVADYVKMTYPALPLAAVGAAELVAGCRPFIDPCMSDCDDELARRLQQLVATSGDHSAPRIAAGLTRAHAAHYLAPAKIWAVDLGPGTFRKYILEGLTDGIAGSRAGEDDRGAIIRMSGDIAHDRESFGRIAASQTGDRIMGMRTELRDDCRELDGRYLYQAGVKLIVWQVRQGTAAVLKTILWDFSRAGIWNHLVLSGKENDHLAAALGPFAAANPNIVHSWEVARDSGTVGGHPPDLSTTTVYSRVQKLPGRPLWHYLSDPVHLLMYLHKHGLQNLMRWRVPDGSTKVYRLGSQLAYHYRDPADLPTGHLDEICQMVADGGSVNMNRVRYNLERAFLIAYAVEKGVIVGNSSLKNPRPEYIETVNRQSGLDLTHYVERGYTSVRPEYRGMGIGARLLGGLTKRAGRRKVFSVISADNEAARKMALRNRTKQVAEYYSPRLGKHVGIWIPERMLDETK